MANLIAFLTGILLTGMIYFNGALSQETSFLLSNVLFHGVGLVFFTTLFLIYERKNKQAFWSIRLILPGTFGALTVIFNNMVVGVLGVSLMVALGLFGQMITSLIIDHFGLLGKAKAPIHLNQWLGLSIIATGLIVMLI